MKRIKRNIGLKLAYGGDLYNIPDISRPMEDTSSQQLLSSIPLVGQISDIGFSIGRPLTQAIDKYEYDPITGKMKPKNNSLDTWTKAISGTIDPLSSVLDAVGDSSSNLGDYVSALLLPGLYSGNKAQREQKAYEREKNKFLEEEAKRKKEYKTIQDQYVYNSFAGGKGRGNEYASFYQKGGKIVDKKPYTKEELDKIKRDTEKYNKQKQYVDAYGLPHAIATIGGFLKGAVSSGFGPNILGSALSTAARFNSPMIFLNMSGDTSPNQIKKNKEKYNEYINSRKRNILFETDQKNKYAQGGKIKPLSNRRVSGANMIPLDKTAIKLKANNPGTDTIDVDNGRIKLDNNEIVIKSKRYGDVVLSDDLKTEDGISISKSYERDLYAIKSSRMDKQNPGIIEELNERYAELAVSIQEQLGGDNNMAIGGIPNWGKSYGLDNYINRKLSKNKYGKTYLETNIIDKKGSYSKLPFIKYSNNSTINTIKTEVPEWNKKYVKGNNEEGNNEKDSNFLNTIGKYGSYISEASNIIANILTNNANKQLLKSAQEPYQPQFITPTYIENDDRIFDSTINNIKREGMSLKRNIGENTSSSNVSMARQAGVSAKVMDTINQLYPERAKQRLSIASQNQQAGNYAKFYNTESVNNYLKDKQLFRNQMIGIKSQMNNTFYESLNNILSSKNLMDKDRSTLELIMKRYNDTGIITRNMADILKQYGVSIPEEAVVD